MEVNVNVLNNGTKYTVSKSDTTYLDIAKMTGNLDALLVYDGMKSRELNKKIEKNCDIRFVGIEDSMGMEAYRRSVIFVMVKSFYDIVSLESKVRVFIDNVIDQGFYCRIENLNIFLSEKNIDKVEFLSMLRDRMKELILEDAVFKKEFYHTDEAIELFKKYHMTDKERLFHYRRSAGVNIYRLHRFQDYYYGNMLPSTGYIKKFDIFDLGDGFLLQCPDKNMELHKPKIPKKLFNEYRKNYEWNSAQGVLTVADLNDIICANDGRIDELIQIQESYHDKQLADIVDKISAREGVKFIMIAGPSSSGKTTFSRRLHIQLLANMFKPYYLGLDNYFKDRVDIPKDESGDYDFECLDAIEVDLFNEHMNRLLKGEEVEIPTYNFITGKKEYRGKKIQLNDNQILIIEGIHGLNDKLSYSLDKKSKFKIYISPLTQLNIDEHNRISTSDVRLIRRIVRDARTRGTSASRTIEMWKSVRRGEEKYIFPFQEEADVMFNSALIYELSVLKIYAQPLLFGINRDNPYYAEVSRLLKFLDYFVGIDNEKVPRDSLSREFIGGSFFKVD